MRLQSNPELQSYLHHNRANPDSCSLVKADLLISVPSQSQAVNSDSLALRQAIFDSLAEVRYTPDGNVGRQSRVTVKVPFRKEEFDSKFRSLSLTQIPSGETSNVDCYITGQDLTRALGSGWDSRCYRTSTKTFVSFKEKIHLSWGYKTRTNYDHGGCKR